MKSMFFKGVALGSVMSMITLAAVSAYAGTGIGGVFNLGKTNTVNATTTLTGGTSTVGPQLSVVSKSNAGNATGINVKVPANRPPFTVNSPTLVPNLNANLLEGMPAGRFQQQVTGVCANNVGIQFINPQGTVGCSIAVVRPFVSNTTSFAAFSYAPTGLQIFAACHDPGTQVSIDNLGASSATLNWVYSVNGSSSVTASGAVLQANHANAANFQFTSRLEGQWIYSEPAYVVTINIHGFDGGPNACEFRGTVEIAPTS